MNLNIQQIQHYAHKNSFFDLKFSCLCVSHSEKTAGWLMHTGRYVFAQVMDYLPMYEFHKCVDRYNGDYVITQVLAYFVIRAKSNMKSRRVYSRSVDKTTGLKYDQTILLTGVNTSRQYPEKLRKIRYVDHETNKDFVFLTNNFLLPALSVATLYKSRWQIELFFKWIKQHL